MITRTVLVVEDSNLLRRLIVQMLQTIGVAEVLEARDGAEALSLLACHQIDLVLSDHEMRGMNGQQLLEAMQADERLRRVPFVMMTANTTPDSVLTAISTCVAGFLPKPFGKDQLEHQLRFMPRFRWAC